MARIALAGYLGNQLFQWAFGHSLLKRNARSRFILQRMNLPTNSWKSELEFLETSCKHFDLAWPRASDKYRDKLLGKTDLCTKNMPFRDQVLNISDLVYRVKREQYLIGTRQQRSRRRLYYGYFQNINFFRSQIPLLTFELMSAVDSVVRMRENAELERINAFIESHVEFQLVHVRRGDFLNAGNEGFGILSPEYYSSNIMPLPIILITDDLEGSKDVIQALKPEIMVDPLKLDAVRTLSLFPRAKLVLSSNSTFSYWGSLLALSSGKRVRIPDRFRPLGNDFDNFYFEGMDPVEAHFR